MITVDYFFVKELHVVSQKNIDDVVTTCAAGVGEMHAPARDPSLENEQQTGYILSLLTLIAAH